MSLTQDTKAYRYGTPDGHQEVAYPVKGSNTLYSGAVALLRSGYLINAASPQSTDIIVGMVGSPAGGTYVKTGPSIVAPSTDGAVWVDAETGSFFFQSGTGADALTEAAVGANVYYHGENATGPIADATSGGSSRPVLGILLPQDPGIAGGFLPGANFWPVKLNVVGGP